ncbi:MAG: hypothetical protein AB7G37_19995 [Solirubrobacteraceae bacterium]
MSHSDPDRAPSPDVKDTGSASISTHGAGGRRASGPVRVVIGLLLIAVGVSLVSWGVFAVPRGPGTCGGDSGGPACPAETVTGLVGGMLSVFVLLPAGVKIAGRGRPEVAVLTVGLACGAAATALYVSRFVAEPTTTATLGTWVPVSILGLVAVGCAPAALLVAVASRSAR